MLTSLSLNEKKGRGAILFQHACVFTTSRCVSYIFMVFTCTSSRFQPHIYIVTLEKGEKKKEKTLENDIILSKTFKVAFGVLFYRRLAAQK